MKVDVNRDVCIGSGQCVLTAEMAFDQDDYGVVVLTNDSPEEADHELVRRAATLCPVNAIRLTEH
jgi:ferredoxin